MIRSAASKVMWVGRATVFLVGLAVILAIVMGLASAAFSATGESFILGQSNSANKPTTLVGEIVNTARSTLVLTNPSGGSALQLQVDRDAVPLKVNAAAGKATNLDADKLDGKEAPLLAAVFSDGSVSDEQNPDVVSSQKLRTGIYIVQFARDVDSCHRVAGLGVGVGEGYANPNVVNGVNGEVSTFNSGDPDTGGQPDKPDRIAVATYDSAGTLADKPFNLAVFC